MTPSKKQKQQNTNNTLRYYFHLQNMLRNVIASLIILFWVFKHVPEKCSSEYFSPHIYSVALPGLIDLKINYSNKFSLKQTKVIKNALRHS